MAILDKIHKVIPRIKTAAGYIQFAFRAQDVRLENNTDLETKINELNELINNLTEKKASKEWTYINGGKSLTSGTVLTDDNLHNYSEFLVCVGVASTGQNSRVIGSTLIPALQFFNTTTDHGNGRHQAVHYSSSGGTPYVAGVSYMGGNEFKLYANSNSYCAFFAR